MATVLLIRHGRSSANTEGILAGRAPGVHLDDTGRSQAEVTGARVAVLPLAAIVTSPLERCRETAKTLARHQSGSARPHIDRRFTECGYGAWTGQQLKLLAKDPLWKTVQHHPSAVAFPDGESMVDMQRRAVVGRACLGPASAGRPRSGRGLGGGQPRRRAQSGAGGGAGHAPRHVPADHHRPRVGVGRALHPIAPLRAASE